jgi:lambda repressor-like predicted transcriptional regulator
VLESLPEMVKKPRSEERQVHPTGERFTVDDRFKNRVRAKLEAEGMSQRDLAEQISVQPATITNLLSKPGRTQSRVIMRILKLWKWQHVVDESNVIVVVDQLDARRRIARGLSHLTDADAEVVASLIESLATRRTGT